MVQLKVSVRENFQNCFNGQEQWGYVQRGSTLKGINGNMSLTVVLLKTLNMDGVDDVELACYSVRLFL